MEYVLEYKERFRVSVDIVRQINFIRTKKEVLLPYELVGCNRREKTAYYRNIEGKVQLCGRLKRHIRTNYKGLI